MAMGGLYLGFCSREHSTTVATVLVKGDTPQSREVWGHVPHPPLHFKLSEIISGAFSDQKLSLHLLLALGSIHKLHNLVRGDLADRLHMDTSAEGGGMSSL